jgi:hypothetical protein
MTSPEIPGVAQAVTYHGHDLAVFRRLADQALRETSDHFTKKWHRPPSGTARSAIARPRLLELAAGEPFQEIEVSRAGEDWVRVLLPMLGRKLRLRTRPKSVTSHAEGKDGLFNVDLLGVAGDVYLFWRATDDGSGLAHLSVAEVLTPPEEWVRRCVVRNEIFITADLIALPASAPTGTGNYDDLLPGVVSRWPSDEAQSEEEATDREDREERDGNGTDSALGGDGS